MTWITNFASWRLNQADSKSDNYNDEVSNDDEDLIWLNDFYSALFIMPVTSFDDGRFKLNPNKRKKQVWNLKD